MTQTYPQPYPPNDPPDTGPADGGEAQPCADGPRTGGDNPSRPSRRAFLGGAGRKAIYVTPALLSLTARPAAAGSGFQCGSQFKHTVGSPCDDTGLGKDCCPTDMSGAALDCVDDGMGGMWCQNI